MLTRLSSPNTDSIMPKMTTHFGRSLANQAVMESFCAALTKEERLQLSALCRRIADEQGLTPGVHPGYRSLGRKKPSD